MKLRNTFIRRREKRGNRQRKSWRDVGSQCWYKIFFRKHSYLYINKNIYLIHTVYKITNNLLDHYSLSLFDYINFAYKKSNYYFKTFLMCKCQKSGYFKVLQHSKKKLESVYENPRPKVPMVTQY